MGLQSQLNDVSSDSIPLLLVSIIAIAVRYLRSTLDTFFQFVGMSRTRDSQIDESLIGAVNSSLAGLILLSEQLNTNRIFSYRYEDKQGELSHSGADCVVCLSQLRDGEQVRRLDCRHVFHKACFDGWLDHLNFNCPLCRSPLVENERVSITERRVGDEMAAWFGVR